MQQRSSNIIKLGTATSRPKTSKEKTTRRSARPANKASSNANQNKLQQRNTDEGENYVSPESNSTPVKPVIEQPLRNMLLQEASLEQEEDYQQQQED